MRPNAAQNTEVDLKSKSWFYDEIPKQNAKELLREYGNVGSFLIRYSDICGQFNMIWLAPGRDIKEPEIEFVDGFYYIDSDNVHKFKSMQCLVTFSMECNYVPLDNKEIHKRASQIRFKRKTERLVFCWWCVSYHDQVHFCEVQDKWHHIDLANFLAITGPSRESVEKYRNNFAVENNIDCTLYEYRVRLKKGERDAVKQFYGKMEEEARRIHEKKRKKEQQKQDQLEAEP